MTTPEEPKPSEPNKNPASLVTLITVAAAVLALCASITAVGVAWVALRQASETKETAGQPGTGPGDKTPATRPAAKPDTTAPKPSQTGPPVLDERTSYTIKYTKQSLTMSGACEYSQGTSMYTDLDEPRVNVADSGSDFIFRAGCGPTAPAVFLLGDNVNGGLVDNPNATPQECVDRIRRAPVGDASIPVTQGVVICLTTSYSAARSRGDRWRVVLIVVTGVRDLRTVTVEATAWDIPT
ncbi:MAG TPA: hypothetical protein VFC19_48465 [Candidatus Limnocylindrales bacterium]|nr:hypothetical protein [Candidatus Limnocylindrales bacterium]